MRECKVCGINFEPTKRINQVHCNECYSLSTEQKFIKRKQTAINISHLKKNLPIIDIEKSKISSCLLDLAHIYDKQSNNNIGKGDKRGRNNPSDISLSKPFSYYLKEIKKTVLMYKPFHILIDRGYDKKYIKEKGGASKRRFKQFEPHIDYLIKHKDK